LSDKKSDLDECYYDQQMVFLWELYYEPDLPEINFDFKWKSWGNGGKRGR
jgi:hypothetical protein